MANRIQAAHPKWNDEAVFNEARKHVIAHHQARIFNYRKGFSKPLGFPSPVKNQ
jgi:hypothetical protein